MTDSISTETCSDILKQLLLFIRLKNVFPWYDSFISVQYEALSVIWNHLYNLQPFAISVLSHLTGSFSLQNFDVFQGFESFLDILNKLDLLRAYLWECLT